MNYLLTIKFITSNSIIKNRCLGRVKQLLLVIAVLMVSSVETHAQLKKTANIEKVKSFLGGVKLYKTTSPDSITIYALSISNNSRVHDDIVLWLGEYEEMKENLYGLSKALNEGKKGDTFDYTYMGKEYNLSYDKGLDGAFFKVRTPYSISSDFGRLWKFTINNIIKYFNDNEQKDE